MKTETAGKIFATVIDMTTPPMIKKAAEDDKSYLDQAKEQAKKLYNKGRNWASANQQGIRDFSTDLAYGVSGGLLGDALVRGLGGRKSKVLRLLGLLGGTAGGMFANRYLNNSDFRGSVNSGVKSLYNKITG